MTNQLNGILGKGKQNRKNRLLFRSLRARPSRLLERSEIFKVDLEFAKANNLLTTSGDSAGKLFSILDRLRPLTVCHKLFTRSNILIRRPHRCVVTRMMVRVLWITRTTVDYTVQPDCRIYIVGTLEPVGAVPRCFRASSMRPDS